MTTLISDEIDQTPWASIDTIVEVSSQPLAFIGDEGEALRAPSGGGLFTIPLIAIGIGVIAMCLLIPAADENRRLAYERDKLQVDLDHLRQQAATNERFLKNLANDPTLAERLARRQMKMVPQGTSVLELKSQKSSTDMSPFGLVTLPPPPAIPEYRPVGGFLAGACRHPKTKLYLIGAGMMMVACGVVMGRDGREKEDLNVEHPTSNFERPT